MLNHLAKVSNRPPVMHSLAHNRLRAVPRTLRTTTALRLLDASVPQPSPTLRHCHHPIPRRLHIFHSVRRVHLNRSTLTQTQQLLLLVPQPPSRPPPPTRPTTRPNQDHLLRCNRLRHITPHNHSRVARRHRALTATMLLGQAVVPALRETPVRPEEALRTTLASDRRKICPSKPMAEPLHPSSRVNRQPTGVGPMVALL